MRVRPTNMPVRKHLGELLQRACVVGVLVWCAFGLGGVARAAPSEIRAAEFQLYMEWKLGREDPRLQSLSESVKLKKIAASLGTTSQTLQAVVDELSPLDGTFARATQESMRAALEKTLLRGRILDVVVDAQQAHAVLGVKWRCGDPHNLDKEMATIAWAAGEGAPIVETLALWCVDERDTKQLSAKVARRAFERINPATIERFASSRYVRLFEDIKRGPHQ